MLKRKCTIIKSSDLYRRHICIDVDSYNEISNIIFQNEKYENKFDYISGRILEHAHMYYDDYVRLFNESGIKISEMRFFPNNDNCRIYCREITLNGNMFCIIMAKALAKKKSQKIDKKINQLIDVIKNYEYEIEQ